MQQECVAPGAVDPGSQRVGPRLAVDPVAQHRREPALGEMPGGFADDHPCDGVARQAAVAVGVRRVGGNDVGRIARDHVEALVFNRGEPASFAALHVGQVVQRRVEPREGERARIDVDGDDLLAVPGEQEPLHAAPGPEVERSFRRPAHGEPGQGLAGGHDAQDAIGMRERKIARDQQAFGRSNQALRMREPVPDLDDAQLLEVRQAQWRQRRFRPRGFHGGAGPEQRDARRKRGAGARRLTGGQRPRVRNRPGTEGLAGPRIAEAQFREPLPELRHQQRIDTERARSVREHRASVRDSQVLCGCGTRLEL